jgi:ABC-type phosphate transport system substrate-binding protein
MERGVSVSRLAAAAVLLTLLAAAAPVSAAGDQLVLIVSADSRVEQLDSMELRKLFLGLTVTHNGNRLRPVLNETDARVKEIFLQNVVSMSDITYDRRLLRLALIQGQTQPTVYKDAASLINAVAADPSAVSYIWAKDVTHDARIKILRVLWYD